MRGAWLIVVSKDATQALAQDREEQSRTGIIPFPLESDRCGFASGAHH